MLAKLLSPATYKALYAKSFNTWTKEVAAGSAAPLFKAMALVGFVGYTIEYTQVGRHHVAEKQKIIKEAMKGHAHH